MQYNASMESTHSNDHKSPNSNEQEYGAVCMELSAAKEEINTLKNRVRWFEKQLFGQKSEKRFEQNPDQLSLLTQPIETPAVEQDKIQITYARGKAKKQRSNECVTESGLRFSKDVPVQLIKVDPPELKGENADQYEVIDTRITHKLAQRPASYVILRYETPVLKHIAQQTLLSTPMPDQVLENSIADTSVLVGLLVEKFLYHLPLHRQHQRLSQAGITVARSTLTNWVKRSIELLRPIVDAQLAHVLQSRVLAMDETPIKAGKKHKGKMHQGYFWPIYGEEDEVVFTYSTSRGQQHIEKVLKDQFQGTLITDGYAAYARYVEKTEGITHAQCWIHGRRKFIECEQAHPEPVNEALSLIGSLYKHEKQIKKKKLSPEEKHRYRQQHSKVIVDRFFQWCQEQCERDDLTPKSPLLTALNYMRTREKALRVFLDDPEVEPDTNHLEREIRPIPMGRRSWLFCWTELGAEHVGIIQSLISTCKLQGINPYTYLIDVMQRVGEHPAKRVEELTPRVWKQMFTKNPMRSVLDREVNCVLE